MNSKEVNLFKDGVADGLLHGERDETKNSSYYKQGYDFGCVMFDMLGTDVCRTKINDKEITWIDLIYIWLTTRRRE